MIDILSHEATIKAVNNFWVDGIRESGKKPLISPISPSNYFKINILSDFLFFVLHCLMLLIGMCVKTSPLFIVNIIWFISLCSNEIRQMVFAYKNGASKKYWSIRLVLKLTNKDS